ncbi:class I SAM-dependent methyltransferase [Aeromicrobium sp. YIM 150415]|uniref:class I SAM-dependent methyltransferase n=1 Tax=Aeromicrobium sp. YIM 150415 TaxID=2803912 RepID=UPI0019645BF3|nr:class I SAM-dependent methyltransferase [Aeromicrobium sp. YIM 150415]MBM9464707.1 class I SAM-dependent methyltransferase [Aeromicrobium sp. YIM 150415]
MTAADLVRHWDDQQAAYIAEREQRFAVMVDVLRQVAGDEPMTVLDLACGPGSLAARVLDAVPNSRVVAVDYDPVLLDLAAEYLAPYGDRVRIVDADLTGEWRGAMAEEGFAGAVSTTALHWLWPADLVRLFAEVAEVLRPGGVFLDGDHFRFDGRSPHIARWAADHDRRTQEEAFAAGAQSWDRWWGSLSERLGHAERVAERDRRFAGRDATPSTAIDFRLAALSQAGFAEVGTAWQLYDDYVTYAVRG